MQCRHWKTCWNLIPSCSPLNKKIVRWWNFNSQSQFLLIIISITLYYWACISSCFFLGKGMCIVSAINLHNFIKQNKNDPPPPPALYPVMEVWSHAASPGASLIPHVSIVNMSLNCKMHPSWSVCVWGWWNENIGTCSTDRIQVVLIMQLSLGGCPGTAVSYRRAYRYIFCAHCTIGEQNKS